MGQSKAHADIIGRITRDAELTYTQSGMALCKFSVVTDDRVKKGDQWTEEPSFWNCTLWGKQGESLNQYLTKGKLVGLDGSLKQESWEKEGQKHSKVVINVSGIVLLGGNSGSNMAGGNTTSQRPETRNQAKPAQQSDFESDIPF